MTEIAKAKPAFEESSASPNSAEALFFYQSVLPTDSLYAHACGELIDTMSELLASAYRINVVDLGERCFDPIHLKKSVVLGNLPEQKDPYIFMQFVLSETLSEMRENGIRHPDLIGFLKTYNACSPDEDPIRIQLQPHGFRLAVKSGCTQSLVTIHETLKQMILSQPSISPDLALSLDCSAVIIERLQGGPRGRLPANKMH